MTLDATPEPAHTPRLRHRWPWAVGGVLTLVGGAAAFLVPAVRDSQRAIRSSVVT